MVCLTKFTMAVIHSTEHVHNTIPAVTRIYRHSTVFRYCIHASTVQHTLQPSLAFCHTSTSLLPISTPLPLPSPPLSSPPLYISQGENNIVPYRDRLIWTLNFEFLANLYVHSWQALCITLCWLSTTDCTFAVLVYVWPLTFACGLGRTLLHWWRKHSVWCYPQTSWCGQGVLSLPLCCLPLCMSMAAVFRLHSLRDHCLALVRMSSPYNAEGIGVWRNLWYTRHGIKCCWSYHLLPFTAGLWPAVVIHTLLALLYPITWQVGRIGRVQNSKHSYR